MDMDNDDLNDNDSHFITYLTNNTPDISLTSDYKYIVNIIKSYKNTLINNTSYLLLYRKLSDANYTMYANITKWLIDLIIDNFMKSNKWVSIKNFNKPLIIFNLLICWVY